MPRKPLPIGSWGEISASRSGSSWRARARFRDYDGRTIQIEASGPTAGAAKQRLRRDLTERSHAATRGEITRESKVTLLIDAWWADFEEREPSLQTIRLYKGRIETVIRPALGELRVRELTVGTVHRFLAATAKSNGPSTAKTCRAILSGCCVFAAQRGALASNVVRDAGPSRQLVPKRLATSLSTVQARQLRALLTYDDVAIHHDVPDLVGFMLATGSRIGEACALTWDAVDVDHGIVEIRGTKTAASVRTVRLPGWCVEMLRRRATSLNNGANALQTLVFPTSTGTLRDPSNVQKRLKEAFERAGFKITSHALRKTVATLMDQAGLSARAAADQLGHSKISTTQDIYFGRGVADTGAAAVLEELGS